MNPYAEYDNFDINDPANERYTTLPSARPDPGVPIAGMGGCGSCGDLGAVIPLPSGVASGLGLLGGVLGGLYAYRYVKKQTTSKFLRATAAIGGWILAANIANRFGQAIAPSGQAFDTDTGQIIAQ